MTRGASRMTRLTPQATDLLPAKSTSVWDAKAGSKELRKEDFVSLFKSAPFENVGFVKHGVLALLIELVAGEMGVSKDKLLAILGLSRATIQRKARKNQHLSAEEASRVLGISRLIGQAQAMVETSGNPDCKQRRNMLMAANQWPLNANPWGSYQFTR